TTVSLVTSLVLSSYSLFFFNDTATTEIYTLSYTTLFRSWINSKPLKLEQLRGKVVLVDFWAWDCPFCAQAMPHVKELYDKYAKEDRKSTRLNSSHLVISYAVFCLKKKTNNTNCWTSNPPSPMSHFMPQSRPSRSQPPRHSHPHARASTPEGRDCRRIRRRAHA